MAPGPLLPETTSIAVMERLGGDEAAGAANSANQSLNPVGMQIYWNLSSLNIAVREAAALALVRELREKQAEFADGGGRGDVAEVLAAKDIDGMLEGCAPAVQYALRRLVRGLGSSRECARQGFSTAFTAVVGALSVLRGEALMRIIPSNLEVTSSMKKQDARDGLLGRLFGYGSLVRSKRLIGDCTTPEQKDLAKEIVEQLFVLAKQKTFLKEPAVNMIIELASRLPSSAVREIVCASPVFEEMLRRDIENQSADALLLVLQLHEKLPALSSPLVPESGNLQDLFEPSHLAKLVPCLKESSSSHPRVHSIWHLLLDRLFSPANNLAQESGKKNRAKSSSSKDTKNIKKIETNLASFWSVIVDGALLSSSHERKNLAMDLLLLVLPRLPNPESVGIVLSNIFVRCILDILSAKNSLLYKSAVRCLSELRIWTESSNLRRVAVIVGLQKNSYGKFDRLSKTATVKELASGLTTEEGVLAFVRSLEELFVVTDSAVVTVPEESEDGAVNGVEKLGSNDKIWIVEQMYALCRQVNLESKTAQVSLYKEVTKFLVNQSIFEASKPQKVGGGGKEFSWPLKPLTENLRKLLVERLHSLLVTADHWMFSEKLKSNNAGANGAGEAGTVDEDFPHFAALHCLRVQKSSDATPAQPLNEEAAESVRILEQTVSTLSSAVKTDIKGLFAWRSLFSLLLLESFIEPGSTDDIAAELTICCSKALPDLPALSKIAPPVEMDEETEVPPVMDVLLDVVLSLLAKASTPVREAAEKVFKVYCQDLSAAGMSDILRILNEGSKSGRHKSMLVDGEDDEEDDDILEDEDEEGDAGKADASQEAKEEGEDESSDEDDDEDGDEEMGDGNGETRSLKEQMRFKRPGEDLDEEAEDSDEDLSDMDDEAMFRADVLLANVLKQKKLASRGNSQTELAHFKFRVLSLLECFLKRNPGSSLVLLAVQGLVKAYVVAVNQLGTAPEENGVFMKRLENLLQSAVFKAKTYPKDKDVDLALTRKLLTQSWKLASRSSIKKVQDLAQASTLWTLKVLVGNLPDIESKGDEELSKFFETSLDDFFKQRKSRLSDMFLSEAFKRHPILGRLCIAKLIEKSGHNRTLTTKFEAMRLLAVVLPAAPSKKGKNAAPSDGNDNRKLAEALEGHLPSLGAAILLTVQLPLAKAAQKRPALQFCSDCIDAFRVLYPQKPLHSMVDTEALLGGIKAIDSPSQGKLKNLIAKLLRILTDEVAKNPVPSTGTKATATSTTTTTAITTKVDENRTPSKKKKAKDVEEVPMEIEKEETTPSKKKKIKNSEVALQPDEDRTPAKRKKAKADEVQAEETPSKKKQQTSSKKVKVPKTSP